MKKWTEEEIQAYIDGDHFVLPSLVGRNMLRQLLDERRWVPVSEQLPEEGQQVLTYCKSRGLVGDYPKPIINWYENGAFANYPDLVVSWFYSPPPPKED